MWQYQYTDELYHHGILGMKWGVRRYQNADGTLTPAGRKKANKLAKKYAEVTGKKLIIKKRTVQDNEKPKQKTLGEMSDFELQQKINRMRLEDSYTNMLKSRESQITPKVTKKGKSLIGKIGSQVIAPALVESGKKLLVNYITKVGNNMIYQNGSKQQNNNNDVYDNIINEFKEDFKKDFKKDITKKQPKEKEKKLGNKFVLSDEPVDEFIKKFRQGE